jgi:hypothetical protein
MTDRERALHEAGVALGVSSAVLSPVCTSNFDGLSGGFSGYGEFTPITVRSYSVPENANLERSQSRD